VPSNTGVSAVDEIPTPAGRGPNMTGRVPAGTGRLGDRIFGGTATGAGLLVIAIVTLIAGFLISQALPALAKDKVNFLTSTQWNVDGTPLQFGIANLLWVTVLSSVIAMLIAVPFGVGVAVFITQYAPGWLSRTAGSMRRAGSAERPRPWSTCSPPCPRSSTGCGGCRCSGRT